MRKYTATFILLGLVLALYTPCAKAKSYVAKQRTIQFSDRALTPFLNNADVELDGPEDAAAYLLGIPTTEMLKRVQDTGETPDILESTLYIDEKSFRLDTTIPMMGSMSYLFQSEVGKIHIILRDSRKYIEMSLAEIQQTQAQVEKAKTNVLDNLPPEIRARLDNLPPEVRQQMQRSQDRLAQSEAAPPVSVQKTGRTQTIHGFRCDEYRVTGPDTQQIWVTQEYPELRPSFEAILTQLPSFDKSKKNQESDKQVIWKEIKKGWPVIIKRFKASRTWQMSMDIQEITSMDARALPADTFVVPPGFEKTTIQAMSMGFMTRPKR